MKNKECSKKKTKKTKEEEMQNPRRYQFFPSLPFFSDVLLPRFLRKPPTPPPFVYMSKSFSPLTVFVFATQLLRVSNPTSSLKDLLMFLRQISLSLCDTAKKNKQTWLAL
jgi:hypothetical protein